MQSTVNTFLTELVSEPNVLGYYYTDESREETQALYDDAFDTFHEYRREYVNLDDTMLIGSGAYGKVYRYGSQAVKVVQFPEGESTDYEPENALRELYILTLLGEHAQLSFIQAFALPLGCSSVQLFTELALTDLGALLHEGKGDVDVAKWRSIYVYDETQHIDCRFDNPTLHRYMNDLLAGVEYIHSCGVLHRDLKPSNLLIKTDGSLAICDLGSAVVSDSYTCYSMVGTQQYNDVTVLSSTYERVYTKECDWWGVGCIVAETTTGMPPVLPTWDTYTQEQQMEWLVQGKKRPNEYQPLLDQINEVVYKPYPFLAIDDRVIRDKVLQCFRV
jgi:serine/threonine protein kinase